MDCAVTLYPPLLKRGITLTPWLILILQWARGNAPYLAHEQVHAMQQRRHGVLTFWFKYITKSAFRQAMEVEAYKAQIKAGADAYTCAWQLYANYELDLTLAQARGILKVR